MTTMRVSAFRRINMSLCGTLSVSCGVDFGSMKGGMSPYRFLISSNGREVKVYGNGTEKFHFSSTRQKGPLSDAI